MEFVNVELKHYNHKVGINYWHLEFTTKYRYKMFGKFKYKSLIEACIRKVAHRHNIEIHVINVMPEHIHILVTLPKGVDDEKAFQLLKGASSYYFFNNHPKARLRYPQGHLWSRGGCAVTVGYNQFSETEQYILQQAEHHGLAC
ncbi:MAG: IS200/IS605 family transposase [Nanoarchaeota archaeon]|nr:IS200/IS605 family transposase [Nanoarchaeota archaeon]